MNSISNRVESEFVGLADCHAGFDSPTGEPDRKGLVVMIAAEAAIRIGIAFHHRGAAEFAAPNDQGVVEQSTLLQILDQGRSRFIGLPALAANAFGDFAMMIPGFVEKLNETDTSFDHPPRQQAVHRKRSLARRNAVHFESLV